MASNEDAFNAVGYISDPAFTATGDAVFNKGSTGSWVTNPIGNLGSKYFGDDGGGGRHTLQVGADEKDSFVSWAVNDAGVAPSDIIQYEDGTYDIVFGDMTGDQEKALYNAYKYRKQGGGGSAPFKGGIPGYDLGMVNYLRYLPEMSQLSWEEQMTYEPLRAQLALDMSRDYLPQQYEAELATASQYMPQFQQLQQGLRSSDLMANMQDAIRISPYIQASREASENPYTTMMRYNLLSGINDELAMGSELTAKQAREVQQYSRSADAARGFGTGGGGSAREAVNMALEGQDLLNQRQQKAMSALSQEYGQTTNPINTVFNNPNTAWGAAGSQYTSGMGTPVTTGNFTSAFQTLPTAANYASQVQAQFGSDKQALKYLASIPSYDEKYGDRLTNYLSYNQ